MKGKTLLHQFETQIDLKKNFDILKREYQSPFLHITMYYLTSLLDLFQFNFLLEELKNASSYVDIMNKAGFPSVSEIKKEEDAVFFLYSGAVILFFEEEDIVLNCDIRSYPSRGISEPDAEKAVRGSRDGFTENIIVNVALMRRRIKDKDLCMEHFILSEKSRMSVVLCYMKKKIDLQVIFEIKKKFQSMELHSLIMSDRALEEKMFSQGKMIFPLVRYTERPDVAAIHVLNGKVAIFVDTSSSCILTPVTLFDHVKHVEEYRETPVIGSFTRFLRSIAIFLSIFLVPVFLCLLTDKDIQNGFLYFDFTSENSYPIFLQALIASVLMEIFRIASIHTPNALSSGISLVAAIILGQISMDLGLFLPEILLFVAISSICSFATPSYELSLGNKFLSFLFLLLSGIFGFEGLLFGVIVFFCYLVSIKVFSVPYLYPICPFDAKNFLNVFTRKNARKKKNL